MHLPPDQSFHFRALRDRVRRSYRVQIIPHLFVVMTPRVTDEISLYYRSRLIAVLNADGEVHLDTHHIHQRSVQRLYDRILADNGYSTRMLMRGIKEMTLVTSEGAEIQRSVRIAILRPEGPIECFA